MLELRTKITSEKHCLRNKKIVNAHGRIVMLLNEINFRKIMQHWQKKIKRIRDNFVRWEQMFVELYHKPGSY